LTVHFENREKLVLKGGPKLKFWYKSMEYNPIINSWWLKVQNIFFCEKTIFWKICCHYRLCLQSLTNIFYNRSKNSAAFCALQWMSLPSPFLSMQQLLTLFLLQGSQPITIKGWDFSQSWNLYTRWCSSSLESLFFDTLYYYLHLCVCWYIISKSVWVYVGVLKSVCACVVVYLMECEQEVKKMHFLGSQILCTHFLIE
jgi:hypothetical protein